MGLFSYLEISRVSTLVSDIRSIVKVGQKNTEGGNPEHMTSQRTFAVIFGVMGGFSYGRTIYKIFHGK